MAATVTAFTVAHSLTLIATTLELISVPRGPVEGVIALLTFNLGVEAGQLLIVGVALVVLATVRKLYVAALQLVQTIAAYGIGSIAVMWLIVRVAGA